VLQEFPALWEDRIGRVIEPEEDWLKIPLKEGATIQSKGPYRVSKRDQQVIDEVFDRARQDGRMSVSEGPNPVGWPVFVVWSKGKGRPVVDLRGLNLNVLLDAYPLPIQEEIIEFLRDMEFISLFDLQKAFYQRFVAHRDRWKLAVVTHRGQELFNVAPMGYCNSPGHMQRFMDKVLEPHKEYARCYIDDVVVFSKTYEDHIRHVRRVLNCLAALGMTLSPEKCYVGYHSVQLLGRMVDRYGLSTIKERTDALAQIQFPKTLRELEHFMGIANYYRYYIGRYAGITDPLQNLKTRCYRGSPRKGRLRENFTRSKQIINPSKLELASFEEIKRILCSPNFLVHHDPTLPLLYYVDSGKEWGYAGAIHQVPREIMEEHGLTVEDIINGNYDRTLERPVMYLSKQLNKHEQHYWSTELEIAGIVWIVQKTRHLIEGNNCVKIYTDHKSAEDILNSTTLKSTSPVRQNLRLTRASQFLSQYPNVQIIHRAGKDNKNADALSRLSRLRAQEQDADDSPDEDVYGFTATVVGLSADILTRLTDGYKADPHFATIYKAIKDRFTTKARILTEEIPDQLVLPHDVFEKLDKLAPDDIQYGGFQGRICYGHVLLYIDDPNDHHPRLCVPKSCHQDFLRSAHDDATHAGFERAYPRLRTNYYIKNLSKVLRTYVNSCPKCQVNKPTHHKPHGELQPIETPPSPCHTVTMDLITKLPNCVFKGLTYDTIMTVTDKLTKMATLIPGREDWSAQQWAEEFFQTYYRRWGVPSKIITDRGKIFLSDFWTSLFRILRTNLLVTTAYHPQTDGQSERTNQTVEIALRHLVNPNKDDWVYYLGEIEYWSNNLVNKSTGKTPMQYLAAIDPRTPLDWASLQPDEKAIPWIQNREQIRKEALDALAFARTKMAIYYDKKHKPLTLKVGDKAYIKLSTGITPGYRLPNTSSKLSQRQIGPFKVLAAVGRLAYKMDLPETWKQVHNVISVAHLEPHLEDPYAREVQSTPDVVEDDTGSHEEWELESIIAKRYNKRRKRDEWYVKWKNWGPEFNTWEPREHFDNAQDQLAEFEDKGNAVINIATTLFEPPVQSPARMPFYKTNIFSTRSVVRSTIPQLASDRRLTDSLPPSTQDRRRLPPSTHPPRLQTSRGRRIAPMFRQNSLDDDDLL
jgi:hypothetical protein